MSLLVRDISVRFGPRRVLDGLTLPEMRAGELTVLAGPNAAGKSTLLRAIAQLVPHRGSTMLDGRDLARLPAVERARLLGFMPQSLPSGSSLVALETVIAALRAGKALPARQADQAAMAVMEKLGIGALALEPLDALSGGQRQMVSLAQAIVRDPRVLLLDEPTSALDPELQQEVVRVIKDLAAEHRTMLLVTHDMRLAADVSDHVVFLHQGRIEEQGPPAQLFGAPRSDRLRQFLSATTAG